MFGKMSVGVRRAEATPKIMISNAITMKVYGRRSASLTMPTIMHELLGRPPARQVRDRSLNPFDEQGPDAAEARLPALARHRPRVSARRARRRGPSGGGRYRRACGRPAPSAR